MEKDSPQCVRCTVLRCGSKEKNKKAPVFCPTEKYAGLVKEATEKFMLPENQAVNKGWLGLMSKVMNPEKPREKLSWTRVDEIMEYARIRGMTRLGIATCYALMYESKSLAEILENNGFDVVSVSCLCGEVNPGDVGMPGDIFCNPIMQAEVLNREKTELNMMVGLCLGHDILFLRYCQAETTPLVVKDRALGHNPVAALYLNQSSFYKDRFIRK
ncbi:MAG: DUF1847 domain-containing protein [Syntrophobacter sp.]